MVAILVLYLTDLDLTEALLFGLCYFVVFWVLTNYTKNVVGPRTTENFDDSDQQFVQKQQRRLEERLKAAAAQSRFIYLEDEKMLLDKQVKGAH